MPTIVYMVGVECLVKSAGTAGAPQFLPRRAVRRAAPRRPVSSLKKDYEESK